MTRAEYAEYLRTPHWQSLHQPIWERAGGRCENRFFKIKRCTRNGRDKHHLTYERLGNERLSDLRLLCRRCHSLAHRRWGDVAKYWWSGE